MRKLLGSSVILTGKYYTTKNTLSFFEVAQKFQFLKKPKLRKKTENKERRQWYILECLDLNDFTAGLVKLCNSGHYTKFSVRKAAR